MSEAFPESIENVRFEAGPEALGTSSDTFEADAVSRAEVMSAREAELLRTLDAIHPETPDEERILAALRQRTAELAGPRLDLKVAAQTAALSVALEGLMSEEGTPSPESEAQAAQLIAKNPELAEMLMQRILAAHSLGEHGLPVGGGTHKLAEEAKALLDELEGSDSKLFKGLALRTAERVIRAVISATTLGIGGIAYDSAKDLYVSLHARSEVRRKHRAASAMPEFKLAA